MAETTRVWVRTSALDSAVYGKVRSTSRRAIPGGNDISDDASSVGGNGVINWGWARGTLVHDGSHGADGTIKVFIQDEESAHNRNTIELPHDVLKDGDLVMANRYRGDDDDEDGLGGGGSAGVGGGSGYYSDNERNNQPGSGFPDDLITLTHLHEPAVVYCLRKRYSYDKIYTSTGPILLALNPFKNCKSLYSDAVMKQYWKRGEQSMLLSAAAAASSGEEKKSETGGGPAMDEDDLEVLPPHVYGIADHSFRSMMTKLEEMASSSGRRGGRDSLKKGCDQSILVSGESGAGKTVTTKFIMQYLATLSVRTHHHEVSSPDKKGSDKNIEQQVLQSNPILESFGNARTIRNDNSSRFGKFIEIQFTSNGTLVGASIETYLLEKVRLITQADGERNYHIFYEILQGMEEDDLDKYFLADYNVEDFRMTSQSGTYDRRDGVEDYETYQDLCKAMDTMGFLPEEQHNIMAVTCACLHGSNLTFNALSADESEIDRANEHLEPVLKLLGITADALNRALCYFSIQAGREKHTRSLPKQKAEKGVEALIKATYGALFTFIVRRINASITLKDAGARKSRGPSIKTAATIGVLDIFGFESFKTNSFEQLCINYCNEALQQQFNLFVLKNEQEEYEREGIQWSFISFPENQDVLDLIDKKGSGILNILDDQCRAPGTTDKTFANDIYQKCTGHSRFEANFRQVGARKFGVFHYAGPVEYDTEGFVEKNRDELPKEATDLLLGSKSEFVKILAGVISGEHIAPASSPSAGGAPGGRGRGKSSGTRITVGGQFSQQLKELRQKIDLTSPHYVRCLKPNDELVPDHFDPVIIADQLRCAGVVEAVRVSRVGYPQRYSHSTFVARYRILGLQALKKAARGSRRVRPVDVLVKAIAEKIWELEHHESIKSGGVCSEVDLVEVGIQVGKTKVFLRRKAYDTLEKLRTRKLSEAAVRMQAAARRYIAERSYNIARRSILKMQCAVRMMIAAQAVQEVRINHNATSIQAEWRRMTAHNHFVMTVRMARWLQRVHRGRMGRKRYDQLNRIRKSIVVQKYWRAYQLSKLYRSKKVAAGKLQCAVRCYFARVVLRGLRSTARDLQATAEERDTLRKEAQRLQNELEAARAFAKLESDRAKAATAALESASSKVTGQVEELTQEVSRLRVELEESQASLMKEAARADAAAASVEELSAQVEVIHKEKEELTGKLNVAVRDSEEKSQELISRTEEIEQLTSKLSNAKEVENAVSAHKQTIQSLNEEIEVMRRELEDSNDAAETGASELETVKKENEELREELEAAKESSEPVVIATTVPASSEELDAAKAEIERLKLQLANAEQRALERPEKPQYARAASVRMEQAPTGEEHPLLVTNETAQEEIRKLTDEVNRLTKELASAKLLLPENEDPNSPESLIRRYDELRRLAEAGIEKDREIVELKNELMNVRDHLEGTDDNEARIASLRSVNEMLKKELDSSRREVSELKAKLRDEAERSAQELEAFAQTLRGVDELRKAAESMSRELQRSKRRNGSKRGGSLWETRSYQEGEIDAYDGPTALQGATKILDSYPHRAEPQGGRYLWAKVRDSMMGAGFQMGGDDDISLRSSRSMARRTRSGRGKRRNSGDNSVSSALF